MTDPIHPRFEHYQNISVGLARVIYDTGGWSTPPGWVLPGCRRTTDRDEAYACAVAMNGLMGGVQTVQEPTQFKESGTFTPMSTPNRVIRCVGGGGGGMTGQTQGG